MTETTGFATGTMSYDYEESSISADEGNLYLYSLYNDINDLNRQTTYFPEINDSLLYV